MIGMAHIFTDYQFNGRERFYNSLGLIILAVAGIAALTGYGLAPLFTGKPWQIVSPGLHLVSGIAGVVLVWLGSGKAIKRGGSMFDASLRRFWLYRVIRWIVIKAFSIIWFFVSVIFFTWIRQSPPSSSGAYDQRERSADDIWDGHPKHYYDNEPPKPFS